MRARLTMDDNDPWLFFYHTDGTTPRMQIGIDKAGSGEVILRSVTSEVAVWLSVNDDGTARIMLVGQKGHIGAVLGVALDGETHLSILDSDGRTRAQLTTDTNGNPELSFQNKEGRNQVYVGIDEDGDAGIWVTEATQMIRTIMYLSQDGISKIETRDNDGNTIWSSNMNVKNTSDH
jgi:hypothetical protein